MNELLTTTEVAEILRVTTVTVRHWIQQDLLTEDVIILPHPRYRQVYRIHRRFLDHLIHHHSGREDTSQ